MVWPAIRFSAKGDGPGGSDVPQGQVGPAGWTLRGGAALLLYDIAGATAIEYGLVTLLMVIGCFTLLLDTGKNSAETFQEIDTMLAHKSTPGSPPLGNSAPQSAPEPERIPLPTWGGAPAPP